MTNEEAIIDIRENIQPIIGGKSLDIAISALEKQIPKKVSVLEMPCENIYSCPNCHNVFSNCHSAIPHGKYCSNCGQALDFNSNGSDTE